MTAKNTNWMNYSIDIAKRTSQSDLQAAVVLVSEHNELICSAFTGEERNTPWRPILLSKVRKLKTSRAQAIYATINTFAMTDSFDLIELLKEVRVGEIYIGLPDPALTCYLDDDPAINLDNVYRYPDELQCEILEQNSRFFADSKQNIKYSPYYSVNRISSLIIEKLKSKAFVVSKEELNTHKRRSSLASLLCDRYGIEYSEASSVVHDAISEAFNNKYGSYNYSDDIRSIDLDWKDSFMSFYKRLSTRSMSAINVLNVGVGSGHEAIALFSDCRCVTFVDIAQNGLEQIKKHIPLSKVIIASAANLSSIPDNSYELYVSLRTYNSSFFEIKAAIQEAHRVLNDLPQRKRTEKKSTARCFGLDRRFFKA